MRKKIKTIIINGANINNITTFFDEINSAFMTDEDWKLGQSLDAFDDMLYGSYGKINGEENIEIIWHNIENSKKALGTEATKLFYEKKLMQPEVFDIALINKNIENLINGIGKTYFDIIMEIIESHNNIVLIQK